MIEARQLVKRFGPTLAVDDLSFAIPEGQIVGFLGPNGAGKTTAIRMLTGFIPPTAGGGEVAGADILRQSRALRRKIGYLPENTPLYPEMRVEEFLHFRGRLYGMPREDRRKRIAALIERCGLQLIHRRVIGALSRGNRQRVGLAAAIFHQPPVLFLDEPTAGLDPNQIQEVRKLLADLRGRHTIVVSSHILPEIEKTADRIILIARGRILADDAIDALRTRLRGDSALRIEAKAPADELRRTLMKVEAVRDVQTDMLDGWCRATIHTREGRDLRETVAATLAANNWPCRELKYDHASLEAFFVKITAEQDQAEPAEVA